MQFIAFAAIFTFVITFALVAGVLLHNVGRIRHHAEKFEETVDAKSLTPGEIDYELKRIVDESNRKVKDDWDRMYLDSINHPGSSQKKESLSIE